MTAFGQVLPCAIGRSGVIEADAKREGDGATPQGCWPLRGLLLRPDRVAPPTTALPWRWLRPGDGWSDAPDDPAYNRPVQHPHAFSAEQLWRADGAYDLIVVLGYNDAPPAPGRGSAIFWHVAQPDFRPTEGCIAIARAPFEALLPRLHPGLALRVD
jgi:L,D-peptidoglycan transpeptidase YkuD (ErfK/YbiS/YcfS/YnhG family)